MGRQIAIAMLPEDEDQFVAFLRGLTEVRIFRWSAPSPAQHEILGADLGEGRSFYVWPTAFEWEPEFKQFRETAVAERQGWFYLSNSSAAPVLQYSRHGFEQGQVPGRLYWEKTFAAPSGLSYDSSAFEDWYERVIRWVRKNGRRHKAEKSGSYYLLHALARRSAA
jgi:hypothetical protein